MYVYLDTEAVALFLASRCCFLSARDKGLLGSILEYLLLSTCDTWLSVLLRGTRLAAFPDEELNELQRDRASIVPRASGPPKPCCEAIIGFSTLCVEEKSRFSLEKKDVSTAF